MLAPSALASQAERFMDHRNIALRASWVARRIPTTAKGLKYALLLGSMLRESRWRPRWSSLEELSCRHLQCAFVILFGLVLS